MFYHFVIKLFAHSALFSALLSDVKARPESRLTTTQRSAHCVYQFNQYDYCHCANQPKYLKSRHLCPGDDPFPTNCFHPGR